MNDDHEYQYPSALNFRAAAALAGELVVEGTAGVSDTLCELLRSPYEISREVRDLLACAIERGRGGYRPAIENNSHVVRLMVEDFGPNRALFAAITTLTNYLDAVDRYRDLKDSGASRDVAMSTAGEPFGLGCTQMRKVAIPFKDKFDAEFDDASSSLHARVSEAGFHIETEDYEYCFRNLFIRREAESSVSQRSV